jgi:hypothetical protein
LVTICVYQSAKRNRGKYDGGSRNNNIIFQVQYMSVPLSQFDASSGAGTLAHDAEDVAATLLLKEVKAMLLNGQPRHAIAHICEVTGVEQAQAAQFVAELQSGVFG